MPPDVRRAFAHLHCWFGEQREAEPAEGEAQKRQVVVPQRRHEGILKFETRKEGAVEDEIAEPVEVVACGVEHLHPLRIELAAPDEPGVRNDLAVPGLDRGLLGAIVRAVHGSALLPWEGKTFGVRPGASEGIGINRVRLFTRHARFPFKVYTTQSLAEKVQS